MSVLNINDLSPVELSRLIRRRLIGPRPVTVMHGHARISVNERESLLIPFVGGDVASVRAALGRHGWHDMGDFFKRVTGDTPILLGTVLYSSPARGF